MSRESSSLRVGTRRRSREAARPRLLGFEGHSSAPSKRQPLYWSAWAKRGNATGAPSEKHNRPAASDGGHRPRGRERAQRQTLTRGAAPRPPWKTVPGSGREKVVNGSARADAVGLAFTGPTLMDGGTVTVLDATKNRHRGRQARFQSRGQCRPHSGRSGAWCGGRSRGYQNLMGIIVFCSGRSDGR